MPYGHAARTEFGFWNSDFGICSRGTLREGRYSFEENNSGEFKQNPIN